MTEPSSLDARALVSEIRQRVDSIERALVYAYKGSAEHGSFLRHGSGEYVPSVFMTLNQLRDSVTAALGLIEQQQAALSKVQTVAEEMSESLNPEEWLSSTQWHAAMDAVDEALAGARPVATEGDKG
jgi:methyl-accepting chemotaxis protein